MSTKVQEIVVTIVGQVKTALEAEDSGIVHGHQAAIRLESSVKKGLSIGRKSGNEEREGTEGLQALAADREARKEGKPGMSRVDLAYKRMGLARETV